MVTEAHIHGRKCSTVDDIQENKTLRKATVVKLRRICVPFTKSFILLIINVNTIFILDTYFGVYRYIQHVVYTCIIHGLIISRFPRYLISRKTLFVKHYKENKWLQHSVSMKDIMSRQCHEVTEKQWRTYWRTARTSLEKLLKTIKLHWHQNPTIQIGI